MLLTLGVFCSRLFRVYFFFAASDTCKDRLFRRGTQKMNIPHTIRRYLSLWERNTRRDLRMPRKRGNRPLYIEALRQSLDIGVLDPSPAAARFEIRIRNICQTLRFRFQRFCKVFRPLSRAIASLPLFKYFEISYFFFLITNHATKKPPSPTMATAPTTIPTIAPTPSPLLDKFFPHPLSQIRSPFSSVCSLTVRVPLV